MTWEYMEYWEYLGVLGADMYNFALLQLYGMSQSGVGPHMAV